MEYPFKDLLPREEATARQGYYRDWTHIDADTFHQISELATFIREKGHGADTREAIAQSLERVYHDAAKSGNANMEVSMARRGYSTLAESLGNLSVNMINKNLGKLDQTFMSEEFLQQMAGNASINAVPADNSLTTSQFTDKSVTIDKTTFAKKGKNLFDGYFVYGIGIPGGVPTGTVTTNSSGVCAVVKVDELKTYTLSKTESNLFRIFASEKYPEIGDRLRAFDFTDSDLRQTVTTGENERYLVAYLSNTGEPPTQFQVEIGSEDTSFESPFAVELEFAKKSINHKAVIDRFGILNGRPDGFNLSFMNEKITTKAYPQGIVLVGSDTYALKDGEYSLSNPNSFAVTICLDLKTRDIKVIPTSEVNLPENDDLIILGFANRRDETFHINGLHSYEGDAVRPYTGKGGNASQDNRVFISDRITTPYRATLPNFTDPFQSVDTMYGIFDALVNEFPDYVTKTLLANEESGLPIYRYDFKPTDTISSHQTPKMILTATHAHEVHADYGLAFFLDDLARNWQSKDELKMLRWNVHLIVVPVPNPYGFENGQRTNFNGVDLNRNYPAGWSPDYTNEGYDYPGTEPLSEVGTQVMDQILNENRDALFVLDAHNYGGASGDPTQGGTLLFTESSLPESREIGEQHVRLMGTQAKTDGYVDMDKRVGLVQSNTFSGSFIMQVNSYGMQGMLLETTNTINNVNYIRNDTILRFNMESAGNATLTALKYFSR